MVLGLSFFIFEPAVKAYDFSIENPFILGYLTKANGSVFLPRNDAAAIPWFEKALAADPNQIGALHSLATIYTRKEKDPGNQFLEKAIDLFLRAGALGDEWSFQDLGNIYGNAKANPDLSATYYKKGALRARAVKNDFVFQTCLKELRDLAAKGNETAKEALKGL